MVELDLKYSTVNNTIQTIWFQSLFSNQYITLPLVMDLSAGSSHQNEVKESPTTPGEGKLKKCWGFFKQESKDVLSLVERFKLTIIANLDSFLV